MALSLVLLLFLVCYVSIFWIGKRSVHGKMMEIHKLAQFCLYEKNQKIKIKGTSFTDIYLSGQNWPRNRVSVTHILSLAQMYDCTDCTALAPVLCQCGINMINHKINISWGIKSKASWLVKGCHDWSVVVNWQWGCTGWARDIKGRHIFIPELSRIKKFYCLYKNKSN